MLLPAAAFAAVEHQPMPLGVLFGGLTFRPALLSERVEAGFAELGRYIRSPAARQELSPDVLRRLGPLSGLDLSTPEGRNAWAPLSRRLYSVLKELGDPALTETLKKDLVRQAAAEADDALAQVSKELDNRIDGVIETLEERAADVKPEQWEPIQRHLRALAVFEAKPGRAAEHARLIADGLKGGREAEKVGEAMLPALRGPAALDAVPAARERIAGAIQLPQGPDYALHDLVSRFYPHAAASADYAVVAVVRGPEKARREIELYDPGLHKAAGVPLPSIGREWSDVKVSLSADGNQLVAVNPAQGDEPGGLAVMDVRSRSWYFLLALKSGLKYAVMSPEGGEVIYAYTEGDKDFVVIHDLASGADAWLWSGQDSVEHLRFADPKTVIVELKKKGLVPIPLNVRWSPRRVDRPSVPAVRPRRRASAIVFGMLWGIMLATLHEYPAPLALVFLISALAAYFFFQVEDTVDAVPTDKNAPRLLE